MKNPLPEYLKTRLWIHTSNKVIYIFLCCTPPNFKHEHLKYVTELPTFVRNKCLKTICCITIPWVYFFSSQLIYLGPINNDILRQLSLKYRIHCRFADECYH